MPEITLIGALLAGILSFFTPCVLPMVPFFLSYLAGASVQELQTRTKVASVLVFNTLFFSLGMIAVFVALGASATIIGQILREWSDVLRIVAAGIIALMGLHFLGWLKLSVLYRQVSITSKTIKVQGPTTAFLLGFAFAFGWTPCVGPILAAILFAASGLDSSTQGAFLLFFYGLGMTLPFVVASAISAPALSWFIKMRGAARYFERIAGVGMLIFAFLIITDSIRIIAEWMLVVFPFFARFG